MHLVSVIGSSSGLAALLWIKLPGESDGICVGETAYLFSPTQARRLTMNSPCVPADGRRRFGTTDGHDRT